jgi:hypothetical protein
MAFKESIISWHIKIVSAIPGLARTLTEQKVRKFLNSRLNLQLGTVDEKGVPNIQDCLTTIWQDGY